MLSFSLIRSSIFSAVDSSNECNGDSGGLLGLFRAGLGEVLHQDAVDLALRPVLGSRGLDREWREGLLAHGHCILKGRGGHSVIILIDAAPISVSAFQYQKTSASAIIVEV